jgi:FkbM family methyltransferase
VAAAASAGDVNVVCLAHFNNDPIKSSQRGIKAMLFCFNLGKFSLFLDSGDNPKTDMSMRRYLKNLATYKSLAGLKKTAALLVSILASKIKLPLSRQAQRLLQHWASFQLLGGQESVRVLSMTDSEYVVNYQARESEGILKFHLRAPISESSDILVFHQIFNNQEYQHVLDWFSAREPKTNIETILDLGANIGCSALFFWSRLPAAAILSLEPEASNFIRLQSNLNLNSTAKIKTHRAAIWTEACKLQCVHDFRDKKESSSRFVKALDNEPTGLQQTDAIKIQDIVRLSGFSHVDLLKMDIEGAEAGLFRNEGFQDFLAEKVVRIAVEVHEEFIKIKEVADILAAKGFRTGVVDEFLCGVKTTSSIP